VSAKPLSYWPNGSERRATGWKLSAIPTTEGRPGVELPKRGAASA